MPGAWVLESGGHTVKEASHSREAIRADGAAPIDLVITEVLMPDFDGAGSCSSCATSRRIAA